MGAAASIDLKVVQAHPQYTILGDAKVREIYGANNTTLDFEISRKHDPYLKYGGRYAGDPKDSDDFHYVQFDTLPAFGEEHKSLLAKTFKENPGLFDLLKDRKTSKGYTLSNVIQTGVVTPHLGVGVTAGDEESWETFKELFYPIIKGWHGYDAENQTHPVDLDASKLVLTADSVATLDEFVVSTRIRAARNISGYSLPAGTTAEDRAAVEELLKKTFEKLPESLKGTYYPLGSLDEATTKSLLDQGFLFQLPTARNLLTGAGAARSWPNNRGIFHNKDKTVLSWVNEEDHCRIISMENGGNIKSVFERFSLLSTEIQKSVEANGKKLSWNEKLGFLGTCPSNLGTGLRASVMVKLEEFNKLYADPKSPDSHLLEEVADVYDLQPRGSNGEHSAAVGGKFDISNKQRLGFSEVQLVQKTIDGVLQVIQYEKDLKAGATPADIRAKLTALKASKNKV